MPFLQKIGVFRKNCFFAKNTSKLAFYRLSAFSQKILKNGVFAKIGIFVKIGFL
jgi:hypothetical protein